jgi:hypothetical protein
LESVETTFKKKIKTLLKVVTNGVAVYTNIKKRRIVNENKYSKIAFGKGLSGPQRVDH